MLNKELPVSCGSKVQQGIRTGTILKILKTKQAIELRIEWDDSIGSSNFCRIDKIKIIK